MNFFLIVNERNCKQCFDEIVFFFKRINCKQDFNSQYVNYDNNNNNNNNNNIFFTEYCWEIEPTPNAVEQASCYSKVDPCPPGLKDCSDEFVCPLSTNKCCCSSSVPPSVSTAPPTPKPSLYYTHSVLTRAFRAKRELHCIYLFRGKRRSLLNPNTAQRSFFPITIFFQENLKKNWS